MVKVESGVQFQLSPIADVSAKDYTQYVKVSSAIAVRFGIRLKDLRKRRGWTQTRTAEELGIDRSYISDLERGKKNVCLPTLEVIAVGFDLTLAELLQKLDRDPGQKTKR